jgi:hypothetical protein
MPPVGTCHSRRDGVIEGALNGDVVYAQDGGDA